MGRVTSTSTTQKSWSEINKIRKEEKRKWKQENLMKKLAKLETKPEEPPPQPVAEILPDISTVSIAIPGSILENSQSPELRTYLSGQIARAACIFQIDEIVVFDDSSEETNRKKDLVEDDTGIQQMRQCCLQLGRILQYLECPQYLRKSFFPIHNDLKYSGILNPLNAPHHLARDESFTFREGIVTNKPTKKGKGSIVDVGLSKDVHVDKLLTSGLRCTVRLQLETESTKKIRGTVVPSSTPRSETGIYWGYSVRLANSLSKVFSKCPYKEGYDLTIGTSDKGSSIDEFECPSYKHLLVVFGGLKGLEAALEAETVLNANDPKLLFDHYLNTMPQQGSKTIRTEEALFVSLAGLRPKLNPECKAKEFDEGLIQLVEAVRKPVNTSSDNMDRFD